METILLSENTKSIEAATKSANERADKLNEISNIWEFESEEEFNQRTEDIDKLVKSAMMARPELRKLSLTVQFDSIRVPDDIAEARKKLLLLINHYDDLFANISHDGHQWIADIDKLEAFAESQRVYATGEKQIRRYEAATALVDFLNSGEYGYGPYQKGEFANVMINWDLNSNGWMPNIRWIVS